VIIIEEISSPPKLLGQNSILFLASKHVLVNHADWQSEIERKLIYQIGYHAYENGISCILKVRKLDIERPEFNPPANI